MRAYEDISYVAEHDGVHLLDLYLPDGECRALFLFLHGGGFVEGSRKDAATMPGFLKDMTDAGFGVASVEYRMYPEAKYPDFIEDAALAVKYAIEDLPAYGEYGKLILGGCSAGAHITQMLCFNKKYFEAVGVEPSSIAAYVHDAGQPTVHFNVLKERGLDSRRVIIDESAPLFHIGSPDSYPPMQFIISDNDIPNRLEETELMIGTLKRFDADMSKIYVTRTKGNHVWYTKASTPEGNSVYADLIIPFINGVI